MIEIEHLIGLVRNKTVGIRETPDKNIDGIRRRTVYINQTRWALTVVDRNNIKHRISNSPTPYTQEFIIRDEYLVPPSAFSDLQRLFLEKANDSEYADLRVFQEAFYKQYEERKFTPLTLTLDCVVTEARLKEYRTLYIANRDVMISLEPPGIVPDHPYSYAAIIQGRYMESANTVHGLTFSIELIDNEQQVSDRYIYLAKQVFHLRPQRDILRASGVYVGITEQDAHGHPTVSTACFSLEEAEEKLGLFKTREEALSGGDVKSLRQEHVAELNHQHSLRQLELKQVEQQLKEEAERMKVEQLERDMKAKEEQTKWEQEKIRMDAEMQRMKARMEEERMRRESHYEQRSYERKDEHEWFKFVSAALVASLGIVAIIMKKS